MKGYELYSWQSGEDWNFSLVLGTNRNKSVKEVINNKYTAKGISNLQDILNSIAVNEQVFWEDNARLKRDGTDSIFDLFKFPPDDIYKKVEQLFTSRGIILQKVNR